ncbi:MAG TPA: hypothetical protein VK932_06360 [Kofleriaceae bacterium]|nr:hypothetical protein [Kofleriaceae bacterium]
MDSDFDSSMRLLTLLPAASIMLAVIPFAMFGPMVLYVIARWRAHRSGIHDPQLGLKFAVHWFAATALHVALAAGAFLIFTLIGPGSSSSKGEMYRVAFALLVPAGLVFGVHLMLIKRTNDQELPGVRRLFLGYNMVVTGIVGFFALLLAFQMLFMKGSTHGVGHLAGALVLVYCSAWAGFGWRLGQEVLGDWGGGHGLPESIVPPGSSQQPPSSAAGGGGAGLPPLGGGAYPPIDR